MCQLVKSDQFTLSNGLIALLDGNTLQVFTDPLALLPRCLVEFLQTLARRAEKILQANAAKLVPAAG